MLWEVEIRPAPNQPDREGTRVVSQCHTLGAASVRDVRTARSFLIQGDVSQSAVERVAFGFLADTVVETFVIHDVTKTHEAASPSTVHRPPSTLLNVLYKPGVTDNVAESIRAALVDMGLGVTAVRTCQKYTFNADASQSDLERAATKVLSNDAIQQVVWGPLHFDSLALGSEYKFQLVTVPIRSLDDTGLQRLSREGQLYLSLVEMQTIQRHFVEQGRDSTDAELETIAQTWSEHCSHKTLRGRVRYRDENGEQQFENLLKETVFAATSEIRRQLGDDDWCVSVFQDNAGVVKFDERQHVCIKVETHNHPSALEPYGGANTGLGGVIRDPMGTGMGAKPLCNTDVFCFAPPDTPTDKLPAGVLHPRAVMQGVVSGVRDYGNPMGIPTVNGAIFFDDRYLGNPLVYCGNVAMLPVGMDRKKVSPGDLIVAVGGRTGRDGIHGATFSSAELTHESEELSGGAVQIGNAIAEKMVMDVILQARDRGLYSAITDCGAGGFSSAVGEMGEQTGAEVWLDKAPLKYAGLSYTEIWISEAQERMVLSVPPRHWDEFHKLCAAEGVEATAIGEFQNTQRLRLKYHDHIVGDLSMHFLHDGRPPVVREATYLPLPLGERAGVRGPSDSTTLKSSPSPTADPSPPTPLPQGERRVHNTTLHRILASLNVCSKEWVIRQYDHEGQAGSVVKPLVGVTNDGPSDAAVVRPDLNSFRGLVVSNGMNPCYGDLDPYWMAASAIDEAVRNCVAVGADPRRIAILDNFCWGNTDRPETLGSLVRAALACRDVAIAYGTPFVSGKDSLNNEFSYVDERGEKKSVAIPPSLLISALGQIEDIRQAVTMDFKQTGNLLFLVGTTKNELGGSHFALVNRMTGGNVPRVDVDQAPRIFAAVHAAIRSGLLRSCHDLSEGGLAVTLAEMSFAGGFGADVSLQPLAAQSGITDEATLLFSESNTRFVIEVEAGQREALLRQFGNLPLVEIGHVTDSPRLRITSSIGHGVDAAWSELKQSWQRPLAWD
ncbi:MAG: phosphoribosylformylglycinamidine synthase subunit PurL [Planctomycetales bacterium]|nr:phosphoribosylformylglycinamidine synthase subunit PurL [Planctomycetales bacterium]